MNELSPPAGLQVGTTAIAGNGSCYDGNVVADESPGIAIDVLRDTRRWKAQRFSASAIPNAEAPH
jgi:hypothetical protein